MTPRVFWNSPKPGGGGGRQGDGRTGTGRRDWGEVQGRDAGLPGGLVWMACVGDSGQAPHPFHNG